MGLLNIKGLEQKDGCYVKDGQPITNFTLSIKKIIYCDSNDFLYLIDINTKSQIYSISIKPNKLNKYFLNEYPIFIETEKRFYKELRFAIINREFGADEILFCTKRSGLQKISGNWIFAFSNGSILKDGFSTTIYTGTENMYYPAPKQNDFRAKEMWENLLNVYNTNTRVFYPFLFINIMAITNGYFRTINEPAFMKLTLWVDGHSGSGKTELSKAAGKYVFCNNEFSDKEVISATARRQYVLKSLSQSFGITCILDDVKKEKVRERKNSVNNCIDDFVRSIFKGEMTDLTPGNSKPVQIDTCGIVTGEYRDTKDEESQLARILYLRVDGFLKKATNSKALRQLQENPYWLSYAYGSYIQWLLRNIEEKTFSYWIKKAIKAFRSDKNIYKDIDNSERLHESQVMLNTAHLLLCNCFHSIQIDEKLLAAYKRNADKSIKGIMDDTFAIVGGTQAFASKIFKNILEKCNIRRTSFEKNNSIYIQYDIDKKNKYIQEYFWLSSNDDLLLIEDYEESLVTVGHEHEEYDNNPCLIISLNDFMYFFKEELAQLEQSNAVSSIICDELRNNCFRIIMELKLIYQKSRTDSKFGRPYIPYPVCNVSEAENENCWYHYFFEVYKENVIQINVNHPLVAEILEKKNIEEKAYFGGNPSKWSISNKYKDDVEKIKEKAYKLRKAFINSKSLYKK